tara:strand:+ start:454 stop:1059 length:606 start_codon:yes stop_codon:yes gene_type:complete
MGYLGNQITTVFPTSISVDSATISGNTTVGGTLGVTGATTLSNTLGVTGVSTLSDNIVFGASNKGVHLGVTSATASNLIDDYEEGTFTPGYSQSSANNVTLGKYTKIGNMVIVNIRLAVRQTSSTTSLGKISGLPFTIHDNCSHLTVNTREYQTTGNHYHANLNPSTTETYTFTRYDNTGTFTANTDFGFGLTFAYAIQGS